MHGAVARSTCRSEAKTPHARTILTRSSVVLYGRRKREAVSKTLIMSTSNMKEGKIASSSSSKIEEISQMASLLMLSISKMKEVSQNGFVLDR